MVRIEELKGQKTAMIRCPRCGLVVTAFQRGNEYVLPKKTNCCAISAREEGGEVYFRFPKD